MTTTELATIEAERLDAIEAEGDKTRRTILEHVTPQQMGSLLAKLLESSDDRIRLRAVELYVKLAGAIPQRTARVKVQSDYRVIRAELGPGQLAGTAEVFDAKIGKLGPVERRQAIEALDRFHMVVAEA